ncbi:ribonuclease H-like domain-containing protein [Lipomyces oligophaga]|uniref:ribonuclease H-like domain-containing protein n=1 Tax=Lipomyces oligophaga TaxID=45792 RepID=UPI0034CEFDC7
METQVDLIGSRLGQLVLNGSVEEIQDADRKSNIAFNINEDSKRDLIQEMMVEYKYDKSPRAPSGHIRYILCMDIEATCHADLPFLQDTHEVIELPVILVDVYEGRTIDEFHTFVKPTRDRILSSYCQTLTGIRQDQIDSAPSFAEAVKLLDAFMLKHQDKLKPLPNAETEMLDKWRFSEPRNYVWVSHGRADIEHFFCRRSCRINRIRLPDYLQGQYIDLKCFYQTSLKIRSGLRLIDMLSSLRLQFEGREHSGIDDARNVARIMVMLVHRYNSVLQCNRSIVMDRRLIYTARSL